MTTPMYIIPPDDNNSLFDILNHYSREIITNPDILLFLCIFFSPLHQQPLLMDRIGMLDSINTDISRFINGYIDVLRHHLSNTDGVNIITASYIFCNSPFLKILIDNEIPIFAPKSIYSYLPGIILSLYIIIYQFRPISLYQSTIIQYAYINCNFKSTNISIS